MLTEEQLALQRAARQFVESAAPSRVVRAAMESDTGCPPELWKQVSELGWTGLLLPEEHGGAGLGVLELGLILEEAGRGLLPVPLLSAVGLAHPLVMALAPGHGPRLFPLLASGELRIAVACLPGEPLSVGLSAEGVSVSGRVARLPDGVGATMALIPARTEGGEWALVGVALQRQGVTVRPVPTLDQTRRLAELRCEGLTLEAEWLLARGPEAEAAFQRVLQVGAILLASEQTGGAARCLELAVDYAKSRVQFGRAIGSFQAIKHACADLLVLVESSRSAVRWACGVADRVAAVPGASAELEAAAALAKSYASDAYFRCAAQALQVHGGIGFTWEHDIHLHLKRARAGRTLLGTPEQHRERLAAGALRLG